MATGPIERAIDAKDWRTARYELARKLARMMDETDSKRDGKAIAHELSSVIHECEDDHRAISTETPLARILRMSGEDEVGSGTAS